VIKEEERWKQANENANPALRKRNGRSEKAG